MENKQRIIIGDRILTREEWYKEEEEFRKRRATLSFKEKIEILVEMQKLARDWSKRKDVIIWKLTKPNR